MSLPSKTLNSFASSWSSKSKFPATLCVCIVDEEKNWNKNIPFYVLRNRKVKERKSSSLLTFQFIVHKMCEDTRKIFL
jgi:hypothetical protein